MQTFFQLPLELIQLTDDEFWDRIDQLDSLAEHNELNEGGFAITLNSGDKQVNIPFIRFKKTVPSKAS
ncbi:MAG: hypothetical protein ABI758_02895 [Candidatus Woesebacteria bacterium]